MKKAFPILLIAVIAGIFIVESTAQEFTYIGATKCRVCHKTEKQGEQYPKWEAGKHSKAFQALSSPEAAEKAKEMGIDTSPPESQDCLKCHGPVPEFKEEGVTCENCHGPGSAYKKLSIMKDHAESVKNGMTEYGSTDAIKKKCLSCHENAHGTSFDFEASWEKIKHPRPDKQ